MILERRAVDARAVGGELLLRRRAGRLRGLDRIARVLQLLARDRSGGAEALAAREVLCAAARSVCRSCTARLRAAPLVANRLRTSRTVFASCASA